MDESPEGTDGILLWETGERDVSERYGCLLRLRVEVGSLGVKGRKSWRKRLRNYRSNPLSNVHYDTISDANCSLYSGTGILRRCTLLVTVDSE